MMNNLMTSTIAVFFFVFEWSDIAYVVTFLWLSHVIFLFFSYSIIKDFRNMMTRINYDRLTKLNNQHRFHQAMDLINQMTQSVSLAAIDIDHFKFYNDTYGHEFGDQVLQKFSEKLLLENNHNVSAYRVGGEEFALVITGLPRLKSEEIVRDFHQHFQNTALEISGNHSIKLTVSIGIAHREEGEQSLDTFRRADKALYFSKENGRNRISVAPSGNISPTSESRKVLINHDQSLN
ncbi:GGDEF domain-containing protein [Fundicoccus ignavus]|nr:GGDEF domain-containing protein [Fundicoccus ignavus]